VFAYNANYDKIFANHFENCQIGIHFTAAIEGTTLYENSFINNESQVKYVSTRFLDWGEGGRGNYWSDNSAFDLDGDGFGDSAYRPNGIIDQIIWRAPVARLLMNSPAISIVKWAQSQFPAILPGGVIDSKPLMNPVRNKTTTKYEAMKDELLHEAKTHQSEWGNAENGALTGGNANM
jgi:nitrous oxide maturation protein nosD